MSRADFLTRVEPHLVADVLMYATEDGGRATAALPGWSCPCVVSLERPLVGWDGLPMLGQTALNPGEKRRVGFYLLSGDEAASALRAAGRFFLWEGRAVGEGVIVG